MVVVVVLVVGHLLGWWWWWWWAPLNLQAPTKLGTLTLVCAFSGKEPGLCGTELAVFGKAAETLQALCR